MPHLSPLPMILFIQIPRHLFFLLSFPLLGSGESPSTHRLLWAYPSFPLSTPLLVFQLVSNLQMPISPSLLPRGFLHPNPSTSLLPSFSLTPSIASCGPTYLFLPLSTSPVPPHSSTNPRSPSTTPLCCPDTDPPFLPSLPRRPFISCGNAATYTTDVQ